MTARPRPEPPPVYAIADAGVLGAAAVPAAVAAMAGAGVRWIQLRAKRLDDRELHRTAEGAARALEGSGAALWIDDRADVAVLVGAAGVHLGQRDLPPAAAREVVGDRVWIGRSTHDADELAAAAGDPEVDVVAVGPVFATASKDDPDPVVGLDFVARARRLTAKPLVAIGGIDERNAAGVLAAGADTVAVIGAVSRGGVTESCRRLLSAVAAGPTAGGAGR
jgi:thiamine-phosphate pyrophosphorylase